nr:HAD-IIB family hydrolase [Inmirania thermothiophila]
MVLISLHGLVRGHNLELGRDADTGGQIKYVVELARALAAAPEVRRVDLLTRQVIDPKVDPDYARPEEVLAPKARIVRLPFGPRRYLRKEVLWPYLDSFVDQALQHVRRVGQLPDVVHGHYADAGYAGARLAGLLGVPFVFTGHSLGRVKRERLLAQGMRPQAIEAQYNISQRIEAEEQALDAADLVVASTRQEVEEQYASYDNHHPRRMAVIPPGVDLARFHPPRRGEGDPPIAAELARFLREPRRPMILALSRPDPRKNLVTLVQAYAENHRLRALANLVIVAGNRDDIRAMERGPREVLTELLLAIDRYDLYGLVAYPRHHEPSDVADLYRLAARRRGVFVNPALTEPFGLTLIEAAASGLPVVATHDGGPREILARCHNGLLVDPLDADAMGEALLEALTDRARWQRWSKAGVRGVHRHYSWASHAATYLRALRRVLRRRPRRRTVVPTRSRLPMVERLLVADIDNTLIGDREGLAALLEALTASGARVGFAVATGRRLDSALAVLEAWGVPVPDILVTAVGAEIHYGHWMIEDVSWQRHIDYRWDRPRLVEAMAELPGLRLQPASEQRRHKLSYFVEPERAPSVRAIRRHLRQRDLHANVIFSHGRYLDLLPIRASKGMALRYLAVKWGLTPERILVAGDSGNDEEMLRGDMLGVVVGNYSPELERLRGRSRVYFAEGRCAWGILEGLRHYRFLEEEIRVPETASA